MKREREITSGDRDWSCRREMEVEMDAIAAGKSHLEEEIKVRVCFRFMLMLEMFLSEHMFSGQAKGCSRAGRVGPNHFQAEPIYLFIGSNTPREFGSG